MLLQKVYISRLSSKDNICCPDFVSANKRVCIIDNDRAIDLNGINSYKLIDISKSIFFDVEDNEKQIAFINPNEKTKWYDDNYDEYLKTVLKHYYQFLINQKNLNQNEQKQVFAIKRKLKLYTMTNQPIRIIERNDKIVYYFSKNGQKENIKTKKLVA